MVPTLFVACLSGACQSLIEQQSLLQHFKVRDCVIMVSFYLTMHIYTILKKINFNYINYSIYSNCGTNLVYKHPILMNGRYECIEMCLVRDVPKLPW